MERRRDILVSVVVPAFNRPKLLQELLESLRDQTLFADSFEVIIVDNSTTDDVRTLVEMSQASVPYELIYHRMPCNRGPAPARNAGSLLARAEILAFTDDDCRVSPDWLFAGLKGFAERADVGFVCGPVKNKPEQPTTFFSVGAPLPGETPTYPTANVFYRKKVVLELGGFDEHIWLGELKTTALESSDTDLAWRTKEKGYTSLFQPDSIVFHEVKTVSPWKWLMVNTRHILVPSLIRKHPGLRKKIMWWGPFALADNVRFYLALLGIVLSFLTHGWSLLLIVPFLYWAAIVPGRRMSVSRVPVIVARVVLLFVRQAAICGFLLYGSLRARTLVM